ncbi:MAG: hypothetical protein B7W98_01275 [Parcubacteria group bacterium 20-58-5]|nr:MAG: hypothetical protein B7W98_01275 [Parcubacteria group bacterium 20-58-5]
MAEKKDEGPPPVHWLLLLGVALVAVFVLIVAVSASGTANSQINVEYFYRVLYDCLRGSCYGSVGFSALSAFLARVWLYIIYLGYVVAVLGLVFIVYALIELFELRKAEAAKYGTVVLAPSGSEENKRWKHIEALIGGTTPTEWREAIIEADIMLDEMLARDGYQGGGVGERLKAVEPADFTTLDDAWEAHKVRNQIAHEGSAFDLSATLARRTVARYESVFREFGVI